MGSLSRFSAPFCLLFLSFAAYGQGSNPFFQPPALPGIPTVVADFNGDGKPDFFASADLTTWLGNGDATFRQVASGVSLPANTVSSILAADVNGDGKIDLLFVPASSSSTPTTLYVFLGNGDGTFQAAKTTNLGTPLGSPVIADLNGDGKPDLVGTAGGVLFFAGKGDGTFAAAVIVTTSQANVLTVGDFNGDGKADIGLANPGGNSPGSIIVLLGNGDGTFRVPLISTGVVGPEAMITGDFNGDGKLDLVLFDSSVPDIVIFLGKGDGTFQIPGAPIPVPVGTTPGTLAAADVNGDGKLDLVAGSSFVEVFLGNGDGTFTLKDGYLVNVNPLISIFVADFNGDGKPDVEIDGTLLLGNGDGSFQGNPAVSPNNTGLAAAATGDFNGDGNSDVAVLSANNASDLYILVGDGTGKLSVAHTYTLPAPPAHPIAGNSIATADLNGDGKLDLVIVTIDPTTQNWSLVVMLGNGDGSFGSPVSIPQTTPGAALVIADFNGDGKPDVAALSSGVLSVFLGHGDGTFAAPVQYFAGSGGNSLAAADFNSDGIIDIATASPAGLGILLGKGDGTFQPITFPISTIGQILATADLNGDGKADLVTSGSGGFQVLLGLGDGTFQELPPTNTNLLSPVDVVDINGDGKLDLVSIAAVGTHAGFDDVEALLGNGDGSFGSPISIVPALGIGGSAYGFVVAGDFYRHALPDLAIGLGTVTGDSVVVTLRNVSGPPAPDFVLAAAPVVPSTVAPGSSGSATITLTSVGGFTSSVALSCSGLPSGANCSFAPVSLSGSGSSTLTITTAASTPIGTYPVLVVGTSSSLVHERAVTLTVATTPGATTISLAPNFLTFTLQTIGATSPPQTVQLTNTGAAQLTISNISISGANAVDFAQSNDCGASVAAGASCLISVTFNGIGARSAAVSVTDNATGSPQMVALSGTGPDFSLTAGSTSSATVTPGQTASYTISLAPSAGFNQMITLNCSGAPTRSTCAVSPTSATLNGAATVNVTVTTTAASSAFGLPTGMGGLGRMNYRSTPILLVLLGVVVLAGLFRWRRELGFRLAPLLTLGLLLWVGLTMTSCGGGSSASGGGNPGTQAGTYTITVSGTFTSGSATLTHSTNLTLVVK